MFYARAYIEQRRASIAPLSEAVTTTIDRLLTAGG